MTREEIEKKAKEIAESFRTARSFSRHPSDIAYNAAIEMANWADKNSRKGLWDSEKVCKVLKDYMLKERFFDNRIERIAIIDNVVCNLTKAMED